MSILVNGQSRPLPEPSTLTALLQQLRPDFPFAVARNGDFIPRATYADCNLGAGDRIDIVHPSAGG